MSELKGERQVWLDQVVEDIIEPDLAIIDPHHHLWFGRGGDYLVEDLRRDTGSGHNVRKTVYIECGSEYRTQGPAHFMPLGETEFVVAQAKLSEDYAQQHGGAVIAGIVGTADLRLDAAEEVLQAHVELGEGRFKGIRQALASAEHPEALLIAGNAPADLSTDPNFRAGVKLLGKMGLSYDSWHYHYQNQAFADLARDASDTTMILDHFGTPLGVGPYTSQSKEIFEQWKKDIRLIADCKNVYAKLGGLAMPDNGYGWHEADMPPSSQAFYAAQREWYLYTIDCFGPERCMMESNFPVDRMSLSYPVLYNGLKKIVADFSAADKAQMFYGTAAQVYKL
jgi:L-fuconolactonase